MRYGVISDVHANPLALEAVLEDIEAKGGVDGYLVLGDLVAQGHDPVPVVQRLAMLPNARFVRGNTDRYVSSRELPHWVDLANAEPDRATRYLSAIQSHAWTTGCLAASGWLDWIRSLPLEDRFSLPDGTRVLCVHASPGFDDGDGIRPDLTDEDLRQPLAGCEAELILVGHLHWPFERRVDSQHVVNPGSTSYSWPPDLRGSYALIEADSAGYSVTHHRVTLDVEAITASIWASDFYPNPEWLSQGYTNGIRAPWDEVDIG